MQLLSTIDLITITPKNPIAFAAQALTKVIGAICSGLDIEIRIKVGSWLSCTVKFREPAVTNAIGGLLNFLGIMQPSEKVEDFGERILQASERGIGLNRMEEFNEYMQNLRNFELDPELESTRPRLHRLAAAMTIGVVALSRRFGLDPELATLSYMLRVFDKNDSLFTPERVCEFLRIPGLICNIGDYLEGRLSPDQALDMAKKIHEVMLRYDPRVEFSALCETLAAIRDDYQDLFARIKEENE